MGLWDRIKENNKNAFRDNLTGTWRSIKHGTAGDVSATQAEVRAARRERELQERDLQFGAGEAFGDRNWQPPVHATTKTGKPVTVAFGKGPRQGDVLICDGHVSRETFYGSARVEKGHDHFHADGGAAADRGKYTDE